MGQLYDEIFAEYRDFPRKIRAGEPFCQQPETLEHRPKSFKKMARAGNSARATPQGKKSAPTNAPGGLYYLGANPASRPEEHILILRDLLQRLPLQTRVETLMYANGNDFTRIASLLISLAPFRLAGFEALAAAITYTWDQQRRSDDLAFSFFRISAAYGVHPLQAVGSQVRILVERGQYDRAEALLLEVFARTSPPPADLCWYFLSLEQQLMRSPVRQIQALQYFVQQYPADQRLGQAWQKIGDLYGNILEDYQKALAAYVKAEQQGMRVPQLPT